MLFIRAGVHKMLVEIADMEDPDQTVSDLQMQSDLILLCFLILKAFLGRARSEQNFKTCFVLGPSIKIYICLPCSYPSISVWAGR